MRNYWFQFSLILCFCCSTCIEGFGQSSSRLELHVKELLNEYSLYLEYFLRNIEETEKNRIFATNTKEIFYAAPDLVDDIDHSVDDYITIEDYVAKLRRLKNFEPDVNLVASSITRVDPPKGQINLRAYIRKKVPKKNAISEDFVLIGATEYQQYVLGLVLTEYQGKIKSVKIASIYPFLDDDQDGIDNKMDLCPKTTATNRAFVNTNGCFVIAPKVAPEVKEILKDETLEIDKTPSTSLASKMKLIRNGVLEIGRNTYKISDFYIAPYETTFGEYEIFCEATKRDFPKDNDGWSAKDHPVVNVSWYDAIAYCNWKSQKDGLEKCYEITPSYTETHFDKNGYRLPTEEEWEIAAGKINTMDHDFEQYAWYAKNAGNKIHPIGKKAPNEFGLYDIFGNVAEWTNDWFSKNYRTKLDNKNIERSKYKIIRGGSWDNLGIHCHKKYRSSALTPKERNNRTGFRLVRSIINNNASGQP